MPTTLPARATHPRDPALSFGALARAALILVTAACFSVLILDWTGLSYAAGGESLAAYPIDGGTYFP